MEEGQTAPDFRLQLAGGGYRTLDDLVADGPVLLAFYKVTCPTCQLALPYLERLQGGAISVFAVCQDDAERAAEFATAFGVNLPNLLDSVDDGYPASNAYGVTNVPSLYLVEPDKRISWEWIGFHKQRFERLAERAGRMIFTPADNVPESKSG
ncbi:MAG TPA: TlpA disulfide reductase family protein [Paludibaculum sp.]|jgi:peroxiredoxin